MSDGLALKFATISFGCPGTAVGVEVGVAVGVLVAVGAAVEAIALTVRSPGAVTVPLAGSLISIEYLPAGTLAGSAAVRALLLTSVVVRKPKPTSRTVVFLVKLSPRTDRLVLVPTVILDGSV